MSSKAEFECPYCNKQYVREKAYMKHKCKEMERIETMRSMNGQAAYKFYTYWMSRNRKRAPSVDTFMSSQYFKSFIRFSEFVHKTQMPVVEKYIDIMVDKGLLPTTWTTNDCYCLYLEWLDIKSTPAEQASITVNTLLKFSNQLEVSPAEVIELLHIREITRLVQLRKLSPWILLCSTKFKEKIKDTDTYDKNVLLETIGFEHWQTKFMKNPDMIQKMKTIVNELKI